MLQGQQFTQRAGGCQLSAEFCLADEAIDRILIGERRPDLIEARQGGQAMGIEPGQVSQAALAKRAPGDGLAAQGAVRRQEQVQSLVNLDPAHKLTAPAGSPDTAALFTRRAPVWLRALPGSSTGNERISTACHPQ
jgi:hypothetical protein